MDHRIDKTTTELKLREQLKVLLYYFAKHNEHPSRELQVLLREVIEELHTEVAEATARMRDGKLKLVAANHH